MSKVGKAKEFRTLRTRTIIGKSEFCEMRGSKARGTVKPGATTHPKASQGGKGGATESESLDKDAAVDPLCSMEKTGTRDLMIGTSGLSLFRFSCMH